MIFQDRKPFGTQGIIGQLLRHPYPPVYSPWEFARGALTRHPPRSLEDLVIIGEAVAGSGFGIGQMGRIQRPKPCRR